MYERTRFNLREHEAEKARAFAKAPKARFIGGPFDGRIDRADQAPPRVLRPGPHAEPRGPNAKRPPSHYCDYRVETLDCCASACVAFAAEELSREKVILLAKEVCAVNGSLTVAR